MAQSWPTCIVRTLPFPGHLRPIRMIQAAFTPISKSTSLQDNPGQPVWYRYNSWSSLSIPHEYNNISAGLGWPMWIGFLSTWVVCMVQENSIERCVATIQDIFLIASTSFPHGLQVETRYPYSRCHKV